MGAVRRTKLALTGAGLALLMAGPAWPIGAVCDPNGGPLERAQCTIDAAGQTGATSPQTWQPTQVPAFVTDQPPETGYFDTSGNPTALDQAAAAASTSPQMQDLQDKRQQAAGWDLSTSPAAQTASAVAQQPGLNPGLGQTCQTTTTCVSWQQTPTGGGTCQTPGTGQASCLLVEDANLRCSTFSGGPNPAVGMWAEHEHWVQLVKSEPGLYRINAIGSGRGWCCYQALVSTIDLRGQLTAGYTVVQSSFTATLYAGGGGCTGGSATLTEANLNQWVLIQVCPAKNAQYTYTYVGSWTAVLDWLEPAVSDGCGSFRDLAAQNLAALQSDTCLDAAPSLRTCSPENRSYTVPPPTGCWRRQLTWLYTSDTPDTCQSYREQGCAQVSSVCGQQDPYGNCVYYTNQYQCMGQTCAAEQTVQMCVTCGDPNGLVPFCLDDATPPDQSLMKTAAWLQVLQNAQDQWDPNTLTIFRGERVQCTHGTGFGNIAIDNCCADPPQGSCSQMDWDAYAARRERRAHYLGEYCSNWVNLLLGKICVELTQAWCAFPTSFARIIHEQGRPALPRGWGTAESPDCGPFTIAEFQRLPFDQMNFSEVYDQLVITFDQQGLATNAQQAASQATGR